MLHAFASGCTAMTGVEAVSNGVPLFREPRRTHARRTLVAIACSLGVLLLGIAILARSYGIVATAPGQHGYESIVSQVVAAVVGRGPFYYATLATVVAVLCLSANTSFADFPRLCRVLALDEYLPGEFAQPGRRLVYTVGILVLATAAAVLLVTFGGITDHLIPLFAVGAFLAFTMSQAGMVAHWRREQGARARRSLVVNAVGAAATGRTLLVIVVSKFHEGAWITVLLIPLLVVLFWRVRRRAEEVDAEVEVSGPLQLDRPPPPLVVVPLKRLDRVARKALRLAISMSPDVQVVQVFVEAHDMENLQSRWNELVARPLRAAGFEPPELVLLQSPYREFLSPLLRHVRALAAGAARRYVAVVVPELVDRRWYHFLLRGHRATLLKGMLLLHGGPRVIVINTPWYLRDTDDGD